MTRRQLFAALAGAPVAAAVAKDPDVIDWSAGKSLVGDFVFSDGAIGMQPLMFPQCRCLKIHSIVITGTPLDERGHRALMNAVTTAPKPMK